MQLLSDPTVYHQHTHTDTIVMIRITSSHTLRSSWPRTGVYLGVEARHGAQFVGSCANTLGSALESPAETISGTETEQLGACSKLWG